MLVNGMPREVVLEPQFKFLFKASETYTPIMLLHTKAYLSLPTDLRCFEGELPTPLGLLLIQTEQSFTHMGS